MKYRTAQLDRDKWLVALASSHLAAAAQGEWDGSSPHTPYFQSCRFENPFRGLMTILTRDVGYHTSGWWKNPDFERCLHLSMSFFHPIHRVPTQPDPDIVRGLINGIFGRHKRWLWVESAYTRDGKVRGVVHYRLFCDPAWEPIKPRGEVYSKELTAAGWFSYSDVADVAAKTGKNPNRRKS